MSLTHCVCNAVLNEKATYSYLYYSVVLFLSVFCATVKPSTTWIDVSRSCHRRKTSFWLV